MSSCLLGTVRVLRDRHLDTCLGSPCPGCVPCPEPHCWTCHSAHAEGTCAGCLATARNNLWSVVSLTGDLAEESTEGRFAVYAEIPGGNALVMLSPGRHDPVARQTPEERTDPRPPLAVLRYWAARWRELLGHPPQAHTSWDDARLYLDGHLHEAAECSTFVAFSRDLSATLRQLEDTLYAGDRPEVSRVPCLTCGTRLVKVWADRPADDHWRCPSCGDRYDRGRFDRAKHDHLASTGADRYVPLTEAVAAIGRPIKTVRTWVARGLVNAHRNPTTGRIDVWWPDVRNKHWDSATRATKSRRA